MFGYEKLNVKLKSIKKDQNSLSATLKRSKKEQKELDEIYEKKVIDLELKLGDLMKMKTKTTLDPGQSKDPLFSKFLILFLHYMLISLNKTVKEER